MNVIDSSILFEALVENTPEGLWSREFISDGELHCPELVLAETTNVLRRAEGSNNYPRLDAGRVFRYLLDLPLTLHPLEPFAERIWELRHNLTCYDAWYVALAESLDCPLVTLDRRISRAGGVRCEVLIPPNTGS